jgi:hypothetical protein
MKSTLLLPFIFLAGLGSIAAQIRSASNFQLLKISQNLISTPQYTYSGAAPRSLARFMGNRVVSV